MLAVETTRQPKEHEAVWKRRPACAMRSDDGDDRGLFEWKDNHRHQHLEVQSKLPQQKSPPPLKRQATATNKGKLPEYTLAGDM